MKLENVLYDRKGAIAYVMLNCPKVLNALNTPTWSDLAAAFREERDDAEARGVILSGAGDRAFIADADIGEPHLGAFDAQQSSRFGQGVLDLINASIAVKFALDAVHKGLETSQGEGCALEAAHFGLCAATDDKREGTTASLAKRAPEFQGR
jgi:enoyl-CoA hydratase